MSATTKNINITRKRVLIAPLDWGLGHTTRCIPIIQSFIENDYEVLLAASGNSAALLSKEFPNITILSLKGYNITYSNKRALFTIWLVAQIPKILKAIKDERLWLKQTIKRNNIDIVISDNRYGLYNKAIKSIFITHQLFIETGNVLTNELVQKLNYKLINKFNECWVPDEDKPNEVAGKLSHPHVLPQIPTTYIGVLSRFKKETTEKSIDLLVLISGPEPQRTTLEKILLSQMNNLSITMVLVRGLPGDTNKIINENKLLTILDYLPAKELNTLIQSSKAIVARSGYSTIMDLITLQQKAILIPTPGQTEQEYLAKYLAEKKYFIAAEQRDFNLEKEMINLQNLGQIEVPISENKKLEELIKRQK